jgi:hypothetical protein
MAGLDSGLGEPTHLLLHFSSVVSLYPQMACFHVPAVPGFLPILAMLELIRQGV